MQAKTGIDKREKRYLYKITRKIYDFSKGVLITLNMSTHQQGDRGKGRTENCGTEYNQRGIEGTGTIKIDKGTSRKGAFIKVSFFKFYQT